MDTQQDAKDDFVEFEEHFKLPFSAILSGPSFLGKSSFIFSLLDKADALFEPIPNTVFYCFQEKQQIFDNYPNVNFICGFDPNIIEASNLDKSGPHILLILVSYYFL